MYINFPYWEDDIKVLELKIKNRSLKLLTSYIN